MILVPAFTFLLGCNSGTGEYVEFGTLIDYVKSRIVVSGTGVANGSSYLYFEVHSENSNGSVNTGWVPQISVSSGASTIVHSCSPTNAIGVSRCAVSSTVPGVKTVQVTNALDAIIEGELQFIVPVLSKTIASIVPGSNIVKSISGGHTISASLSALKAPLRYEDPSGHIIYSTTQGVILSDDF